MSDRSDVAYAYDGSFEGLLCCVFQSYEEREVPIAILPPEEGQGMLYPIKWVETDAAKAKRVYTGMEQRISKDARELVQLGFLLDFAGRDLLLYRFIRIGFKCGKAVMSMLTDDTVAELQKRVRYLQNEAQRFKQFLRFSVYDKAMVAVIEPKDYVLPLLSPHFCDRYHNEAFLIYDKTHRMALVYRPHEEVIVPLDELVVPLDELVLPRIEGAEAEYRRLWKRFYDTIAVEGRENPRCRMSHMPKWYWKHMTEFDPKNDLVVPAKDTTSQDHRELYE